MENPTRLIVLCEGNENDQFFFLRALKQAGLTCEVKTLVDGNEAFAFFQEFGRRNEPPPSAVFFTFRLPGRSGKEVLQALRANPQLASVPVILLTGSIDPEERAEALRLGAIACYEKPVRPDYFFPIQRYLTGSLPFSEGTSLPSLGSTRASC